MGLDSVELVLALEGEFGVEIPEAAAERMRTPRDVIEWLVAALNRREFSQPPPPRNTGWFVTNHQPGPESAPVRPVLMREAIAREAIAESVRRIVIEQLGIRPGEYREDGRFVEDFGMD